MEARTSGPNELIKALATDFGTSEGRTAARDGVQARLSGSKPAEILQAARAFAEVGVDTLVISVTTSDPREAQAALDMVGREVLPALG